MRAHHVPRFVWFLVTLSLCDIGTELAFANNNLFLPGDAFFPTKLTADTLAELEGMGEEPPLFTYSNLGGYEGAFCGYAGYNRAKIPAVDKAFVSNLKKAYARIRLYDPRRLVERKHDDKTDLVETNGIRVLFYPADFDFPRFTIGLQYNENWVAETSKFGHPPKYTRLCCLIDDPGAVADSWRDSTEVPPLEATLPDVELKPVPETNEPVTIKGDVKAIVVGSSRPLKEYAYPDDDGASLLIVDSTGITDYTFEEGEWQDREEE